MNEINCFEPIIDKDCNILILGSIPSRISRKNSFYYSNKSNRFWKLLSKIYNIDFTCLDNEKKRNLLLKNHIAMFDVYKSCNMKVRESSLDSNIMDANFNDIISLIKDTCIKTIYITSKKAYQEFTNEFGTCFARHNVKIISLPSPSSANRRIYKSDDELYLAWKKLFNI